MGYVPYSFHYKAAIVTTPTLIIDRMSTIKELDHDDTYS